MSTEVDGDLALQFLSAIVAERQRAHALHGTTSMEQSDLLSHRRASILMEEAAECGRALNDHEHGAINLRDGRMNLEPDLADPLDKEMIQTAAMAYTWWANRRGDQLDAPEPGPREIAGYLWTNQQTGEVQILEPADVKILRVRS